MEQFKTNLRKLSTEVNQAYDKLGLDKLAQKLAELDQKMSQPDFWRDSAQAQDISREAAHLRSRLEPWLKLKAELEELAELIQLGEGVHDELQGQLKKLQAGYEAIKSQLKFQGPYDDHDVILNIYAGAGGTDAQDWAQMLLRMYSRWAESQKLKAEMLDESRGDEAGIKAATLKISGGDFLYGRLSSEHGVHRLVRLSPFNADHKRQTSFAKVEVMPLIVKPDEVEIDPKDLKVDVFRSGGRGGQSVNTTDSAVRITHLPTNITVSIQNERSQLQNKETALSILRSKLVQLQLEQHTDKLDELKGPAQSAEWGSQIRSYVLHPYKQVKDLRSGFESSDPQAVLDGKLEGLLK